MPIATSCSATSRSWSRHGREFRKPREIGVGVVLDLDAVLAVEEVRRLAVGTGELAECVGRADAAAVLREALVVVFLLLQAVEHDVVIDRVHAGELGAVDRLQPRELVGVHALEELDLRRANGR